MSKQTLRLILWLTLAILPLIALVIGIILIENRAADNSPAARSSTMPPQPYLLYLSPAGIQRGLINAERMQRQGVTPLQTWAAARQVNYNRAPDALLIDAAMFETMTAEDSAWLQSQYHQGVVIVSLGLEDEPLAAALGLKSVVEPDTPEMSIGPLGYVLVQGYNFGQPAKDPVTQSPAVTSSSFSQGKLDSEEEISGLFINLKSSVEGYYQTKAEYQRSLQEAGQK